MDLHFGAVLGWCSTQLCLPFDFDDPPTCWRPHGRGCARLGLQSKRAKLPGNFSIRLGASSSFSLSSSAVIGVATKQQSSKDPSTPTRSRCSRIPAWAERRRLRQPILLSDMLADSAFEPPWRAACQKSYSLRGALDWGLPWNRGTGGKRSLTQNVERFSVSDNVD